MKSTIVAAAAVAACVLSNGGAQAAPEVLASIKPVHAIATAVMEGVGEPALLLPAGASPHTYALKPSDAAKLAKARLVFWIGPELETFLERPLATLSAGARAVELAEAEGGIRLPAREGGPWDAHGHDHDHDHDHDHKQAHDHEAIDAHLWLDPMNAAAWARAMAAALAEADPANAVTYRANAERFAGAIADLDGRLKARLAAVRGKPFVVFHDAYQYFEARYGLRAVGSITISPERAPSAKRLTEIRTRIRDTGAACVFAEPQFPPKLVATVTEGTNARMGTLDPIGSTLPTGAEYYPALLSTLADNLHACLNQ